MEAIFHFEPLWLHKPRLKTKSTGKSSAIKALSHYFRRLTTHFLRDCYAVLRLFKVFFTKYNYLWIFYDYILFEVSFFNNLSKKISFWHQKKKLDLSSILPQLPNINDEILRPNYFWLWFDLRLQQTFLRMHRVPETDHVFRWVICRKVCIISKNQKKFLQTWFCLFVYV